MAREGPMRSRDEALALLKSGLSPGEIARRKRVSLQTILGYLNEMVGRGKLRRSDILLSVPPELRRPALAVMATKPAATLEDLRASTAVPCSVVGESDLRVVLLYGDARHALGDAYDDLRSVEIGLHRLVRQALEERFGPGESEWWRHGVPETVRKACQVKREEDDSPASSAFAYTNVMDLRTILDKSWQAISPRLAVPARRDKRQLLRDLLALNRIRRQVMHPVRGECPTEEDLELLAKMRRLLGFAESGEPANGSKTTSVE